MTFITTDEQISRVLRKEIKEALKEEKAAAANPEKLFSVYKTSQKLGVAYNSVVRWVAAGRIAATSDGKYISQQAIDDFITGKK